MTERWSREALFSIVVNEKLFANRWRAYQGLRVGRTDLMKIKCRPEDFQVEELAQPAWGAGPYALYLLTKRSLGTLEVLQQIRQRWRLSTQQVSYAGLKDKHALTRQWVSIFRGPRRDLHQSRWSLVYQGQAHAPISSEQLQGNRFDITLRDLSPQDQHVMTQAAQELLASGVPNYFDEQRFGSVGSSGQFIAEPWCLGDYERTLWLMLAEPNPHDRPRERQEKAVLREHWGEWHRCQSQISSPMRSGIVQFLREHPSDFRRAVALVPVELRSLYLAAFQSWVWNAVLSRALLQQLGAAATFIVTSEHGSWVFPSAHAALISWREVTIPLPSARLRLPADDPWRGLFESVLATRGLTLRQLRVKYPRDSFFSKGERPAVVVPQNWEHQFFADELYPSRWACRMQFVLPKGSYATLIIKRLSTAR
ncbi:MAG: tRNA pseudouridine synthase D [Planctomycetaceae bacterium]|nr:MAG: tRNA pseudouridine synthase D [Planctomycetaceae bacterium]